MPRPSKNTEPQVQKSGSGFIELFNLNRLMQTVDSIAVEAKDEEEMLQLVINALSIFTGYPLGHIFLRDAIRQNTFRCSDIHYVKYLDLYEASHKQASSNVYDESSLHIKQMTAHPAPSIDRDFQLITTSDAKISFRVLIPIVSRGKLFGFFELIALEGDEEPNQPLMQVFHQVGYRIGSVLDSFITSKELEAAKANDEAILSSIGEGLVVADSNEAIVLVNKAAVDMLKWKADEMVGKPWFDVLKPVDQDGKVLPIKKRPLHLAQVSGKKVFSGQYEFLRKDKTKFPVVITATPVSLEDESIGAVIVFRDATQEREIQKLRDEFVFIAAHELRSPVTSIRGAIELMFDAPDFPKYLREDLEIASSASDQLNQLVNDLLQVARSEAGATKIEVEPLDIIPLINSTIKELSTSANKKHIKVSIKTDKTTSVMVLGDSQKTKEVVTNLLSNAIKYNREKGAVDISLLKKDSSVTIEFKDTGYGIPKEQQDKIFQKFYRAKVSETREVLGTGLGLFITRMLVEKMGGNVIFTSVEGKGSTFAFSLPL